jgi:hypothetical protein
MPSPTDLWAFSTSPAETLDQNAQVAEYEAQLRAAQNRISYDDSLNVANFIRMYPSASPELAIGIGESKIPYTDPLINDIVQADARQADSAWHSAKSLTRTMVRDTFEVLDSLYEEGYSRPLRSTVRMFQGEGPMEAWTNAGASSWIQNIAARQQGIKTTAGTGWIPGETNYGTTPEFGRAFTAATERGAGLEEAMMAGHTTSRAELGIDRIAYQRAKAEETQASRTIDGVTYSTPVSPGRLLALPFTTPGTLPFQLMSGSVDSVHRVAFDPINSPADELTQLLWARRHMLPAGTESGLTRGTWHGLPRIRPDRQGTVLRRGTRDVEPILAGEPRGMYAHQHRTATMEVEGYVFHGSRDPESLGQLSSGGLSFDLLRAQEYAQGGGVVHAYRIADLPQYIQSRLRRSGDIEFLRPTARPQDPEIQRHVLGAYDHAFAVAELHPDSQLLQQRLAKYREWFPGLSDDGTRIDDVAAFNEGIDALENRYEELIEKLEDLNNRFSAESGPPEPPDAMNIMSPDDLDDWAVASGFASFDDWSNEYLKFQAGDDYGYTSTGLQIEEVMEEMYDLEVVLPYLPDQKTAWDKFSDVKARHARHRARQIEEAEYANWETRFDAVAAKEPAAQATINTIHDRWREQAIEYLEDALGPRYREIDDAPAWGEEAIQREILERLSPEEAEEYRKAQGVIDEYEDLLDFWADRAEEKAAGLNYKQGPVFGSEYYPAEREFVAHKSFTPDEITAAIDEGAITFGDEIVREVASPYHKAGVHNERRPWVIPIKADEWLRTGRGQRIIRYIANTKSIRSISRRWPQLDHQTLAAMAEATTEAEVIGLLRPHLGVALQQAPRLGPMTALGSVIFADDATGIAGGLSKMRNDNVVSYMKRVFAETEGGLVVLDPTDPRGTMDVLANFMETYRAKPDDIDEVLTVVAKGNGAGHSLIKAKKIIRRSLKETMEAQGLDPDVILKVMDSFDEAQIQIARYFEDNVANQLNQFGENPYPVYDPASGEKVMQYPPRALHETQFASQHVALIDPRTLRRATAGPRRLSDKLRKMAGHEVLGLEISKWNKALDTWSTWWRAFTLLRVGWMMRVLPDEIARTFASGYSDLDDAAFHLAIILGRKDAKDLYGGTLDDIFQNRGIGAGTLDDLDASPYKQLRGTKFDRANTDWGVALADQHPTQHREGIAARLQQLFGAKIPTHMIDNGIDATEHWLRNTPEGQAVLDDIVGQASRENNWTKAASSDDFLRAQLEAVEADVALISGGDILYRKIDPETGQLTKSWYNSAGKEIPDFSDWNAVRLNKALDELGIPTTRPNGQILSNTEKRRLLQADVYTDAAGNPINLADVPRHKQYIVLDEGSPEVRGFIATGMDAEGVVRFHPEMDITEMRHYVDNVMSLYDGGYRPPQATRYPKPSRNAEARKRWTDSWFEWLGQKPTNNLLRSPFAQARYFDEVARLYIFSDEGTRAALRAQATELVGDTGIGLLNRGVQRALNEYNLGRIPAETGIGLTVAEIDTLAKYVAIEDSKTLFYDLAKKSNLADISKHIFPFADAWWEILTTWGRLTNPYKIGGQAIRNIRRPEQAIESARESGWFQEDQFGNEVFSWYPGAGLLSTIGMVNDRMNLQSQASLEQQLFVDFGNPRSFLMPGVGPIFQAAAAHFIPRLPGPLADKVQWFTTGDFPATDVEDLQGTVETQLPTYMKRALQAALPAMKREQYANDMVRFYQALINSGDPRWGTPGDQTVEQQARAVSFAQEFGTALSIARIFDAYILPASPQYKIGFMAENAEHPDGQFYVNVAAFAAEFAAARQYFDEETAMMYMYDKFGVDPFNSLGTTRSVMPHPVTVEAKKYLDNNPEVAEHAELTLLAWLPDIEGDLFSQPAWQAAFKPDRFGNVDRQKYNVEMAARTINHNVASHAYHVLGEEREEHILQAESQFPEGSHQLRAAKEYIDDRHDQEVFNLGIQHLGWKPNTGVYGHIQKPKYLELVEELKRIGTPGSVQNRSLSELNPELVTFVTELTRLWNLLDAKALEEHYTAGWWRTSTSETNPNVEVRRQWFQAGLQASFDTMTDEQAKKGASRITERILTFVIEGYDLEDPMILEKSDPPFAKLPDTIPQGVTNGSRTP